MKVVLIADAFPPMRSSAAVQLRDLAREFALQGHYLTLLIASPGLPVAFQIERLGPVKIIRLRTPVTKGVGYLRRTIAEIFTPFFILWNSHKACLSFSDWEGVIWYSPTIFLGPIAFVLKKISKCPSYLIIRDIFPDWALDMEIIGRGLPYYFFKMIANIQYLIADVIGVQTPGNIAFFSNSYSLMAKVEVLQNWLADVPPGKSSIVVGETALAGRKIFVYAGNMGVAQNLDIFIELAGKMRQYSDVGFIFVGRGSESNLLRDKARIQELSNILFYDEIDPDEIPGLYAQCTFGVVSLDIRHKTHNIPGKYLSYMQAGLPVLARINPLNDLAGVIIDEDVGRVSTNNSIDNLCLMANELIRLSPSKLAEMSRRSRSLYADRYTPSLAVQTIVSAINR